ncbi:MAG: hypothetical protein ACP5U0_09905 [Caldisphaera sp.]
MVHNPTYIRDKFIISVNGSNDMLIALKNSNLEKRYKEEFAEYSFLKVYIEWETFLEDSFFSYLLGRKAKSGYKMKCYVKPKDLDHAKKIIASKPTNKYESWNYIEVDKRADLFFKENRYSMAFSNTKQWLEGMTKIRNHIAHRSEKTKNEFEQVVRDRLQGGTVPRNITVGKFLLTEDPNSNTTIFKWYVDGLVNASKIIIPEVDLSGNI